MLRRIAGFMLVVGLLAFMLAQTTEAAPPLGGPGNENEKTVKVLRTTNKAQTNHYVCEALEFKNVNPYNVVNFFWAVVSREEGGIYSFCNSDANGEYLDNGYVVVICPEYQLETLRQLAKDLDKKGLDSGPGSTYTYYRMKHRNGSDPDFLNVASWHIGATGVLAPDVETNSVLIYDAPAGAGYAEETLKDVLDKPLRQVEMGIKVYEVDVNRDGTLGLDFQAWKNGPGKGLFSFRYDGATISFRELNGSVVSAKGSYANRSSGFYGDYPSAFFDFLAAKGKAQTLTDTKVLAFSGKKATITAKDEILAHQVLGERDLKATRTSLQVGVDLAITPTVGDGSIKMVTKLQASSLQGYDGKGVPIISGPFALENTMSVPNGVEAYLGGVTREKQVKTTRKVPILGSIPVLGYLFGGEISTNQKTMIVASVRPALAVGTSNVTDADTQIATEVSPQMVKMLP